MLPPEVATNVEAATSYRTVLEDELRAGDDWAKNVVVAMGEEAVTVFWRQHFLHHAQPRYLPDAWLDEHLVVITKE
jgi:hypothetical protein